MVWVSTMNEFQRFHPELVDEIHRKGSLNGTIHHTTPTLLPISASHIRYYPMGRLLRDVLFQSKYEEEKFFECAQCAL